VTFLRKCSSNVAALIGGVLSIPLTICAVYFPNVPLKVLFAVLAAISVVWACYRVWRESLGTSQATIESLTEQNLSLSKSSPIMDSSVGITERQVNPGGYAPFHYIVTSIHNCGDLAARKLHGHWRLYSPDQVVQERDIPIIKDALRSTPYEFEPCQLIGPGIDEAIKRSQGKLTINVDIEFDYLGHSEDQPLHYCARYQYNRDNKQMARVSQQT
jgi:hypothetical protein